MAATDQWLADCMALGERSRRPFARFRRACARVRARERAPKADHCAAQFEQLAHDEVDVDDSDVDDYARPPIERLVTTVHIEP
jgi:hypothetical protein